MRSIRGGLAGLAWLGVAILIALGGAGLVTAMDAPLDGTERPELTWVGDARVTPILDAQEAELERLEADVTALAAEARTALAALNGADLDRVQDAVTAGDALVVAIRQRTAAIGAALDATPLIGTTEGAYQVSGAVQERHARLVAATGATAQLEAAWGSLTVGSLAASRLSARLAEHDEAVVAAAAQGRAADYDGAIETLDAAEAAIADARTLRDRLAATVDVGILDEWLDRNGDYDTALRRLYAALRDVGGRVTAEVREAVDAERAAKERLPPDSRGLILIMSDIGRGGMNGAVIAIEEARGALADALAAARPSPGLTPPP